MSDLWTTWMGGGDPLAVLAEADRGVTAGQYRSREEAFLDIARKAIRSRSPEVPYATVAERLSTELLAYAESAEQIGP